MNENIELQISKIDFKDQRKWDISSREMFGILLSAPACYIRGWNVNHIEIEYYNENKEEIDRLLKIKEISNKESLLREIDRWMDKESVGKDYNQFLTFWFGNPDFDENELGESARHLFQSCKNFADKFYKIVGTAGFYAWDYAELIPFIRMGFMRGWLDYKEASKLLDQVITKVCRIYNSYERYAKSYICGGVYYMYKSMSMDESAAYRFMNTLCDIVKELLSDTEYWKK